MKWRALIRVCLVLLLAGGGDAAAPVVGDAEDEMKAAVLLGFLRFSEWPAPAPAREPIVVGYTGRPAFGATLKRTVDGKTVNGREVKVVEWNAGADAQSCNVVYLASDSAALSRQLATLRARIPPPLTLGDAEEFLDAGGAIRLMLIDGRMTFEVRMDVLEQTRVNISSKLLRFGQIRRQNRGGRQ